MVGGPSKWPDPVAPCNSAPLPRAVGAVVVSPALRRLLRNCSASLSMKGIKSPSPRVRGRHRVAPVARLGLRECQNIPSPLQRAKEDNFCANRGFRKSLFSVGWASSTIPPASRRGGAFLTGLRDECEKHKPGATPLKIKLLLPPRQSREFSLLQLGTAGGRPQFLLRRMKAQSVVTEQ
jgi:hypothetical protein